MSGSQHKLAQDILNLLKNYTNKNSPRDLTYIGIAERFGRNPKKNARAIAQACYKLDAACALAKVPLIALDRVRSYKGEHNPSAWKNLDSIVRSNIIERSNIHNFSYDEMRRISLALEDLHALGNRASWKKVFMLSGGEDRALNFISSGYEYASDNEFDDAINDIGVDNHEFNQILVRKYKRNISVRDAVRRRAKGRCEFCGKLGFKTPCDEHYIECHHIIALADDGEDTMNNVIGLCAEHHREAHFGKDRVQLERKMQVIVQEIEQKALL